MNTTLKQMTLPTPKGDEVLDMTEFATNESVVNGLASVESKVETESQAIQSAIQNIDLSSVEGKVDEVKQAVDNIKLPEIDTTELAKEATLNAVSSKLDNLNVEVDLSSVAQQGENQDATMSAVLEEVMKLNGSYADQIKDIVGE